ncbi:carbohydrate ABC transporter permease [Mumia zhuanghuii]|uniref:Sugar ABC transporter permease n=1 Tax=Mumia zhuanghuii TaxID=2585211 RepID=A0A5C4MZS5_9ACTN|nr:sugar ABC transporter permease [Mumia zhuanghuii]TNC48098.1 sugar ABC transporter permease [Mumia zhuanghuii]TNC50945.1 sugar ABC transporter permease [Mumia zhuanghuii]
MTSPTTLEPTKAAPESGRRAKTRTPENAENRLGWKLAGPAVAVMLLVTAWPMLRALYLSLFSYRLTDGENREFIGISNYGVVLSDPLWWRAVGVAVFIMVVTVAVELVIGFGFAMVMNNILVARGIVRASILVPYGIITVVSAYAWLYAFQPTTGFVNQWLHLDAGTNMFDDFWGSIFVICLAEIWKTTPFVSLLLLAGLSQVPNDAIEAATVDGATWWQRLTKVILPSMRAAIMVAVLFRALDAYRIFDSPFIMTGFANGTAPPSGLVYNAMIQRVELGLGSAMSVLLFLSVLIIAFGLMKLFRVDLSQVRGD